MNILLLCVWKIVEIGAEWDAVCIRGQRSAEELVGHAVQGATVFLQALMGTERCVGSVTQTWWLMETNLSVPRTHLDLYFSLHNALCISYFSFCICLLFLNYLNQCISYGYRSSSSVYGSNETMLSDILSQVKYSFQTKSNWN